MKIVIVGAGVIGTNLASSLTQEQHEVYVIEENAERARKLDEKLDVKVIVGSGTDPQVLASISLSDADLVIAVTASDETNLVVCSLAACAGAKRRIARVRSNALSNIVCEHAATHFNVDAIINPEEVTAQAIVKTIETPGAREVADFADGKIFLRAFEIPSGSPLCKAKIGDLREEDFPWPFLIIALVRKGQVFIPKGETVLAANDRIYVLLPAGSLGEFLTFLNPEIKKPRKVVIYGANDIGMRVARVLSEHIRDIVLLEEDKDTAETVAGQLEGIRMICGSAAEADILTESGIEATDVFVATSSNDPSNLISAVLAKKMGAKITIIITQHPDYMAIADTLNIDALINPRLLAVDQILRLVRGKGIQAVATFMDYNAEAMEFVAERDAPVTRAPIKEISFPRNSIIGAVCSGKEVMLAKGDTRIKEGDRVIVFSREPAVRKLQELFTSKETHS